MTKKLILKFLILELLRLKAAWASHSLGKDPTPATNGQMGWKPHKEGTVTVIVCVHRARVAGSAGCSRV